MRTFRFVWWALALPLVGCGGGDVDFVEVEPNNNAVQAKNVDPQQDFLPGDGVRIGAAINPAGDVDFFAFTLTATADVVLQTSDDRGGDSCTGVDTVLELLDTDGTTSLSKNDDISASSTCSLIDAATDPAAQRLAPGTYFAKVTAFDATALIGAYQLKISLPAICGDNQQEGSELCDDGNLTNGDGCNDDCTSGGLCGNGVQDAGEQCDDGNLTNGDGCSALCQNELQNCGDGNIDPGEECDDGGAQNGDGCDQNCQLEEGCGDGNLDAAEECDDNNIQNGDGCDAACQIEDCNNNGVIDAGEQCDDGNISGGDGCNAQCQNEPGNFGELEPNDGTGPFQFKDVGAPPVLIHGKVDPVGDVDFYGFQVPATADLRIETFDGNVPPSGCINVDTALSLIDTDGATVLASDDEQSTAFCSVIDSTTDDGARGVTPGLYFVRIAEFGNDAEINGYQIRITFNSLCGDSLLQGSETCDDGNVIPEDGCNEDCQLEPGNLFEAEPNDIVGGSTKEIPAAGLTTVHGELVPAGDVDTFVFLLDRPSTVRMETFDGDGAGNCGEIDTELRLFVFDPTVGSAVPLLINGIPVGDDDSGVFDCAAFFVSLTPGLYFIKLNEFGNDDQVADYQMEVEFDFLPICGDGFVAQDLDDPISITEECDDRNGNSNDGCSDQCQVEDGCGDANLDAGEACDDGDTQNGDGCSSVCLPEFGFTCTATSPSICTTLCGDGDKASIEQCDDGNVQNGDGCSSNCFTEAGHFFEIEANDTFDNFLKNAGRITNLNDSLTLHGTLDSTDTADILVFSIGSRVADIRVETFSSPGQCIGVDTVIQLFKLNAEQQGELLAFDDDDGLNQCSLVDATFDVEARNLLPGDYAIRVVNFDQSASSSYQIEVEVLASCGDGVRTIIAGIPLEDCDDGNTADNDACQSDCVLPPP